MINIQQHIEKSLLDAGVSDEDVSSFIEEWGNVTYMHYLPNNEQDDSYSIDVIRDNKSIQNLYYTIDILAKAKSFIREDTNLFSRNFQKGSPKKEATKESPKKEPFEPLSKNAQIVYNILKNAEGKKFTIREIATEAEKDKVPKQKIRKLLNEIKIKRKNYPVEETSKNVIPKRWWVERTQFSNDSEQTEIAPPQHLEVPHQESITRSSHLSEGRPDFECPVIKPVKKPKLAVLMLTVDEPLNAEVWKDWLDTDPGRGNIYVNAKNDFTMPKPFQAIDNREKNTKWGDSSLVKAHKALLRHALVADEKNMWFILVSGDSIPVISLRNIIERLENLNSHDSLFDIDPHDTM